jgi:hypothetical protein
MLAEVLVFFGIVIVVAIVLLWRGRRGGSGAALATPPAAGDRPEPAISNESSLAPHRNVGRPWRVDHGEQPPEDEGSI